MDQRNTSDDREPDLPAARSTDLPVALVDVTSPHGSTSLDGVRLHWSPSLDTLVPGASWATAADLVAAMARPDRDEVEALLHRTLATGEALDCRFRLASQGRPRSFRLQARPDADSAEPHWVGALSDVTDTEEQRAVALLERRRIDDVLGLLPGFVYEMVTPPSGPVRFTYVQRPYSLTGHDVAPWMEDASTWIDTLHPDDQEPVRKANEVSAETGEPFQFTYRERTPDGEWRWLLDTAQSRVDESGNRIWAGFIQDVTEQHQLERGRAVHVRRLLVLLERMHATVYEVGAEGLSYISPGPLCGHPSQLFRDDPAYWRRVVHPDDLEYAAAGLQRAYSGPEEVVQDLRVRRPDGSLAWARNHLVPYLEDDGSTSFIGIVIDITGLKEAEETARVASQRLRLAVEHAGVVPYEYRDGEARTEPGGAGEPLVVHADDEDAFRTAHDRAQHGGVPVSGEFRHRIADGEWRWALARASQVAGKAAGERAWVSGVLVDTTADHVVRELTEQVAEQLTPRELDVFRLLGTGATNRDIAEALVISPHTAIRHVAQVLAKLKLPNRAAAAALAERLRTETTR